MREYLNAHIFTFFFTNFTFEHNGVALNEYTELSELDLVTYPRIYMRPTKYDDKAARSHIKKLVSILESPSVLTTNQKPTSATISAPRSRSASQVGDESVLSQSKLSENDEKLQKNYEDFL